MGRSRRAHGRSRNRAGRRRPDGQAPAGWVIPRNAAKRKHANPKHKVCGHRSLGCRMLKFPPYEVRDPARSSSRATDAE